MVPALIHTAVLKPKAKRCRRSFIVPRTRSILSVMRNQLTDYHFVRAYRMSFAKFHQLLALLGPELATIPGVAAVNGIISPELRLSCAIRFFCGGDAEDLVLTHGISHTSVMRSVWRIVDAIHRTPELDIRFPSDHAEQRKIAKGFQDKSSVHFPNCVGAIDGIVIWTEKPSEGQCAELQIGSGKFYCSRKAKFGFTCYYQLVQVVVTINGTTSCASCGPTGPGTSTR